MIPNNDQVYFMLNFGASKKTLCDFYRVDYRTLKAWCEPHQSEIGEYVKRYTPKQVKTIFKALGTL